LKNNWIKLKDAWSRDGRAKKYTNKIYGDNHIHYTSQRLLFSIIMHLLMLTRELKRVLLLQYIMLVLYPLSLLDFNLCHAACGIWLVRGDSRITGWFIPVPHIATQKASVGMYSGCDYPHKSCLYTFWPYHPYFILQFYSIVFYTCYYSFFIALWAKPVPSFHVLQQHYLAWFDHSIVDLIDYEWLKLQRLCFL
jgi:hypothetical protein